MKVKGKIKLFKDPQRSWVLVPVDLENVKQEAIKKFIKHDTTVSVVLDMELKRPFVSKSLSQLGYLHAAVWPVFYQYYEDQGIPADSADQKERIRNDVKWAIGWVDKGEVSPISVMPMYKVNSFADASKEEASEAIEKIIRLAAEYGMIVPTAAEYLEQHNATEFE